MAEIELVVKIPEEYYENLLKNCRFSSEEIPIVSLAIATGTPLPKKHGDLVDVEEVKEYLDNIQQELDGWGETDSAIEIAKARMGLDSVLTIIEADKAKSVDENE